LGPLDLSTIKPWPVSSVVPEKPKEPSSSAPAAEPTASAKLAAAPANEATSAPEHPPADAPAKIEYGIDLGGASSLWAVRVHWAAVKANYGPLLVGLHPLVAERAKHPAGVDYRLVAGPLPDAAAAAQLCTRFTGLRTGCRSAKFTGTQLEEH
jgi:hypothetical protein